MGLKKYFLVTTTEFSDLVELEREINSDILRGKNFENYIENNNLKVEDTDGLYAIYHFEGMHEYSVLNEFSEEYAPVIAEAARDNLETVWSYIKRLQELDLYDDATIIIIGDHGIHRTINGVQPIFFIKEPYASQDSIAESKAMISVEDIMPTIMKEAGYDFSKYGNTIFDIGEDEERERTVYKREYDKDYPKVKNKYGFIAKYNCLYQYNYIGDKEDLRKRDTEEPDGIIPLKNFFE
jgi:hypothetical protein